MSLTHAIERQAQIASNILSMYTNSGALTSKIASLEEFEKAYPESDFLIVTEQVRSNYAKDALVKASKIEDIVQKNDFLEKATKEVTSFEKINVVAGNKSQAFYVKKKEVKAEDTTK